jgi:PPM family protein phosphatase
MVKIISYGKTDIGAKRDKNQDKILLNNSISLYAVADGMGGHKGGEIASSIALEVLEVAIKKLNEKEVITNPVPFLKEAVSLASMKVYEKAILDSNLEGMGTTLVAIYIHKNKAYIMQVGDSRLYLIRDKKMWRITEDHSLVNEQFRSGLISKKQVEKSSYKNVITRSVGFDEMVDADIYTRKVLKGDVFLLCSDGLSSMISDDKIIKNFDEKKIEESTNKLIDLANKAGGNDNISVVSLKVK